MPASFKVPLFEDTSDIKTVILGNEIHKYADDAYLLVPSNNSHLIQDELCHIQTWSTANNLRLNRSKSTEMIVRSRRTKVGLPPHVLGLNRVDSLNILGVTVLSHDYNAPTYITDLVISCNQALYALKIIKAHGMSHSGLLNICRPLSFLDCCMLPVLGARALHTSRYV